jgi:hypothetical protein
MPVLPISIREIPPEAIFTWSAPLKYIPVFPSPVGLIDGVPAVPALTNICEFVSAMDDVETVITAVPPLDRLITSADEKNIPVLLSPVGAILGVVAVPAIVTNCPDMLVLPSCVIVANIPSSILFRFVALIAGELPLTHYVLLYAGISSSPLY